MGRITVFTADDLHSKVALASLKTRKLPYVEINIAKCPGKRKELQTLCSRNSVPQVFFNTRHIGGVDELDQELRKWDVPSDKYPSPAVRYEKDIKRFHDPTNKAYFASEEPQDDPYALGIESLFAESLTFELPDKTTTSVRDMMEKLRNSLPLSENTRKNVNYNKSVTGKALFKTLKKTMDLSDIETLAFGQKLLKSRIIEHLTSSTDAVFINADKELYRLQCCMSCDVLNSYRIWDCPTTGKVSCSKIVEKLDRIMTKIETDCIDVGGFLDFAKAHESPHYSYFEDQICQLQIVRIDNLQPNSKLAFALNVHNLMMKYAFLKIGVPQTERERNSLVANVKFNVGSVLYSFDDWVRIVIRGQRDDTADSSDTASCYGPGDGGDHRVHFAINVGSIMGNSVSPPFRLYTSKRLDDELQIVARVFFEDPANFDTKSLRSGQVLVSKVLKWGRPEFSRKYRKLLSDMSEHAMASKKKEIDYLVKGDSPVRVFFKVPTYTRYIEHYVGYNEKLVASDARGLKAILHRFRPPAKAANEALRLGTLRKLNILDTLPEERIDRITRMAKSTFDVPLVFVSLVDENRQWFKSTQWACTTAEPVSETGTDVSFCGHAILGKPNEVMWVEDATEDDRFADNPLVTGPLNIRFYAGCSLSIPAQETGELVNIGTLCVIDQKPRAMNDAEVGILKDFAAQVKDEILRRHQPNLDGAVVSSVAAATNPVNTE